MCQIVQDVRIPMFYFSLQEILCFLLDVRFLRLTLQRAIQGSLLLNFLSNGEVIS